MSDAMTPVEFMRSLDRSHPGVPLAAFGQSALWDEAFKGIVAAAGTRPCLFGIHDLDHFSRLRRPLPGGRWQIVTRNDGALNDVWIAAGELPSLFGAEVWPRRQALAAAGVRLDRLPPAVDAGGRSDRVTESWGWRGLLQNTLEPWVLCDAPAAEMAGPFCELIGLACRESAALLADATAQREARRRGRELCARVRAFVAARPDATASDLYKELLREMHRALLGEAPANVSFIGTRELLQFNRATARLARFRFVGHFLGATADRARGAYDGAIEETMSRLGEQEDGALPFEVYAPGRGRGELRLTARHLRVGGRRPVEAALREPVTGVEALAAALEEALGPGVALTGKALVLPAMLAGEFIMLFMETGSAYLPRTGRMLSAMRAAGLVVEVHPIARLGVHALDAVGALEGEFRLPAHLAQAFGRETLPAAGLARHWRGAVRDQRRLLQELRAARSACELTRFIPHTEHPRWFQALKDAERAGATLLEVQRRADGLRHRALALRAREDEAARELAAIERRRGEFNRTALRPLKRALADLPAEGGGPERERLAREYARAERAGSALLLALEAKVAEARRWRARRKALTEQLRSLERRGRAAVARRVLARVERLAERARLRLARNALLVCEALPHVDARPSAWWPVVLDPSGRWFAEMARAARARLEPLEGE